LLSDDTDTDATTPANVTNAQVKKYEDHRLIVDGNPHGTNWDQLEETASYIPLNVTDPSGVPTATPGTITWNSVDGTVDFQLYNNTTLQAGQELYFYGKASGAIANGDLCQFAGVEGDHIKVKKAVAADIIAAPHYLVGVATQNIANNAFGYITWFGKVNGVYTKTPANQDSADWTAGDILYFDNTTGQMTKTAPDAPEVRIIVAAVIKEQTGSSETGIILIRPTFGTRFTDLDDVDGSPTEDGQFYIWDNTNKWFEPTSNILIDDTNTTIYSDSNGGTAKDLHIATGAAKTLVLDTVVWDDVYPSSVTVGPGASAPAFTTYNGNLRAYEFLGTGVTTKDLNIGFQFYHSIYTGGSITLGPHLHLYIPDDATGGVIKFYMEYTWAEIGSTGALTPVTISGTVTRAANAGIANNAILSFNSAAITGSKGISSVLMCRIYRDPADTADTFGASVWLKSADVHIPKDTQGSRQEYIK